MKKQLSLILFILISAALFVTIHDVWAQEPTVIVEPAATGSATDKNIERLKEKIATKVAELQIKNKKVVSGFIEKKTNETIDIKDLDGKISKIAIDQSLTSVYTVSGSVKREIELSDLTKNDYIVVTGSQLDGSINASLIYKDRHFIVASGKIIEVMKADFSIKVTSLEKDTYTLDIESTTKQQILDTATLKTVVSGFSKFKEGDTIHFVFEKPVGSEKNTRFTASRTLIIPQEFFTIR